MEAGEIVGVLQTRAACLPGSRDRDGRPLIIVTIPTELQPWTKDNLDLTLRYFASTFTTDTRRNGMTVLVDGQKTNWRVARACIRHIGHSLGPDLVSLIVVRPDAFWDKQRMDNCTKIQKEGEPVYISLSRLYKYINNSQLPEELGGTWVYDHNQWIQNRLYIESFMREARNTTSELEMLHTRLTQFTHGGDRLTPADYPIVFSKQTFDANKTIAQKVLQTGKELITQIDKTDVECKQNSPLDYTTPQDIVDTRDKLEKLLDDVKHKQELIDKAWIEMEKKFRDAQEINVLESGVSKVTNWILNTAETMLNTQQDVGYDVPSSEELRSEHEALELQCRETYGQYAELLHKIDTLPKFNVKVPDDLKSQRDFMDFVCRSFATRLERRRNILITCLRFYRLVTEYFQQTSEVFETLVMCADVESLESADYSLNELQQCQTNIEFLAKELVKEGEKLSDMLSMPVKDALGRDIEVNYESDIINVQEILQASLSRKRLFSDSVDLQKLTLEQVTHIHVYEKDASQAIQWLKDLFDVMLKEHVHVGCNVREIQTMKDEHQAFQETVKGTYEYGCQLLQAALTLRHSCKLPEESNTELSNDLWQVWNKLQTVGQEQMTRLRVSAVFHRSVEEQCKQLKELNATVHLLSRIDDHSKKKSKLKKCLQTRERLLLEVGRMVRLGRLLRTRLKEPVITELQTNKDRHITAVEAITERLSEVTSLAEQLDNALCGAQAESLLNQISPNTKKILDGAASSNSPEEWYNSSKVKSKTTPNTSNESKSEDEFVTASECTCTPPSRSSSFHTASEGGTASPWWDVDPTSDSDDKTKTCHVGKHSRRSPAKINTEMSAEIVVREVTETTNLKVTTSPKLGITSYLLEKSTDLLRPDMGSMLSSSDRSNDELQSSTEEIVRKLTEIVQNNENYLTTSSDEPSPTGHQFIRSADGDTSSQYSSELLNTNFETFYNPELPNHSKSLSYETDNTEMSLPKFSGQISTNTKTEIPRFESPERRSRSRSNDSSKVYIIDTTTPSPRSKPYMETSFDNIELYEPTEQKDEELLNGMSESRDWIQLKVLEVQPELTKLGVTLQEAVDYQTLHDEVLRQIENKQSPVEELLRQADQLIATRRPRAEVYAAMAESLGLAWKDVNHHLQDRKYILELNVNYKTREQVCLDRMEQLEIACQDVPVPVEVDAVKNLLNRLQTLKKLMLESLMTALQDGKILLDKMKEIAGQGTLDSRPDYIRISAQRAVSQVEHWLESLHDKRRLLEITWQTRKQQVEQCLALAILATELLEIENVLNKRKETLVRDTDQIGNCEGATQGLLMQHMMLLPEARELQERTLKIIKSTENLVSSGHFAGEQAISQAYSVLNECVKYIEDVERREELLKNTLHFYHIAYTAIEALDEIQTLITTTNLPATSSELAELHSNIANKLDQVTDEPLRVGEHIINTLGDNSPGVYEIKRLVNEINNRKINLEGATTAHREDNMEISQVYVCFLEKYNELYSWLITNVEAFLQGHQDMGSVLPMSRDFLKVHNDLQVQFQNKESEYKGLLSTLTTMVEHVDSNQRRDIDEKVETLQNLWFKLRSQLETRVELTRSYVKFHSLAVDLSTEFRKLEEQFRETCNISDQTVRNVEEKWLTIQQLYVQLAHVGKNFMLDAVKVMDVYLDIKRASLCVETLLEQLANRQLVISETWYTWQCNIDVKKEVRSKWHKIMADSTRTVDWTSKLENQLYPILLEDYDSAKDFIKELERKEQIVIPEVKKAQSEIELRVKAAESLTLKGEAIPPENEDVVTQLKFIHDQLQKILTEYEVLIQILLAFFKNLSEVEKTLVNIDEQNELQYLPRDLHEVNNIIKDHETSTQTLLELFKFTKNESETIINKIRQQEPAEVREKDVEAINSFLLLKQKTFENQSLERKMQLEQHRLLCQFDCDLREIDNTLSELNSQLLSVRGQYGESLPSAKATSQAFVYFERTIELLQERIDIFIKSGEELSTTQESSADHIEQELKLLQERWNEFYEQVTESRKLIDLSLEYFSLIEEAEDWFREGSKLLVVIARKATAVKKPEEATELLNEVEMFLKPGERKQDERIQKISDLANQIYGEEGFQQLSPVLSENKEMIDSFNLISEELNTLAINLKSAEEEREKLKLEQAEVDAGLTAAKAEVVAAKAAAAAAEEARKTAESAARILQESFNQVIIEEIEAVPLPPREEVEKEKSPSPEKLKIEDIAPLFVENLVDLDVHEGDRLKFECKVVGIPQPEVSWYKEGISVNNNPDYQTSFDHDNGLCSLIIEETFTEDSARFTCRAENSAGSAETSAVLTVKEIIPEEVLAPPVFDVPLEPVVAREGDAFELRCHTKGNPLPTVQWYKGDDCIDNSSEYTITYNNGEAVLSFDQVFLEDDSMYSCKASNKLGIEVTSAELKVEPLEPTEVPKFVTNLSNVMARAGEKIKLDCSVTGLPLPDIQWTHDGKAIKPSRDVKIQFENHQAQLTISEAFPNNAGTYTVTAKNIAGEAQTTCTVVVKGRLQNETSDSEIPSDVEPVKPTIHLHLKNLSMFEGKQVRLDCIIVGQPEPEVIWYHDGQPVKESDDFQLLFQGDRCSLIINEAFIEDAGDYKVVAINSAGEASSACHLSITAVSSENETRETVREPTPEPTGEKPKFTKLLTDLLIMENEDLILECCVNGNPKPDIRWYLNNQSVDITNRTQMDEDADGHVSLTIHRVEPSDKGVYTIKATNNFGDVKCFANVIVKPVIQPEANEPPTFKQVLTDKTVSNNEEIVCECVVCGKPAPEVRWYFNEELVEENKFQRSLDGDRHTLRIPSATKDHIGVLSCVARNEAGQVSCSAKLFVQEPLIQHDEYLIPFLEPVVTLQDDVTSASSITTKKQMFMHTSSSKQVTTSSSDGPEVQVHSFTSHDETSMKQTDKQPLEVAEAHKTSEFHRVNENQPELKEQSSFTLSKDGQIIQESSKTNVTTGTPALIKSTRKSTAPRFLTPIQGKIIDQGESVLLEAIVDGYPQPTVTWTKNGQELPINNNLTTTYNLNRITLELKNAETKDAGKYSCQVASSVGSATSTADIVVRKTVFPPVLGKRLQPQVIVRGERTKLEVEVTGTPDPTVTWSVNDTIINSNNELYRLKTQGNSHTLLIDKAGPEHAGRYSVKATNAGGMAQSIADISIVEAPTELTYETVSLKSRIEDLPLLSTHVKPKTNGTDDGGLKMDKVISESKETTKHITKPLQDQTESLSITETTKTEKTVTLRLERSPSPCLLRLPQEEKQVKPEQTQEIHEKDDPNIERSSISKRSALDFFMNKMKEEQESEKKPLPPKPLKIFTDVKPEEQEVPPSPEIFSMQSELISQFKTFHVKTEEEQISKEQKPATVLPRTVDPITMVKESYSIVKEEQSSDKSLFESKTFPSIDGLINGFDLKPEPPPEMGYVPKPEAVTKPREDIAQRVKKLEEFHRVASPVDAPSGGVRLIPPVFPKPLEVVKEPPKEEIKREERKIETLPPLSWLSKEAASTEITETCTKKEVQEELCEKKVIPRPEWTVRSLPALTTPAAPVQAPVSPVALAPRVVSPIAPVQAPVSPIPLAPRGVSPITPVQAPVTIPVKKEDRPRAPILGPCADLPWMPQQESRETMSPKSKPILRVAEPMNVRPQSPRPSAEGIAMQKLWTPRKSPEKQIPPQPATMYRPASSFEPLRAMSPRPSAEGVSMEKLWTSQQSRESVRRPATSLGAIDRSSSPKPSQEGLAMDKIWAHKHKDSTLKRTWPPPSPELEKPVIPWATTAGDTKTWPPTEQTAVVETKNERFVEESSRTQQTTSVVEERIESRKVESYQESFQTYSSAPTVVATSQPIQHYIAEPILLQQSKFTPSYVSNETVEEKVIKEEIMQTKSVTEDYNVKPSKLNRVWPPPASTVELQAPTLVKQASVKTPPARCSSVPHDFEPVLQPGPPPEVGFSPAPARRTSYVETIEQDLQKDLQKQPSKQLAGSVRIIPPQTTTTKQKKQQKIESNHVTKQTNKSSEKFPVLEPFPYKPDPPRPKHSRCPPPPTPTKFVKGNFTESEYESDYELRISAKWRPYESDNEEMRYRKVRPPSTNTTNRRPISTEPEQLPPSKFETPLQLDGPPRPVLKLEEARLANKTTKTVQKHSEVKKTEQVKKSKSKPTSPPKLKPGSPPEYVEQKPKTKIVKQAESGYMADTDEPIVFRQKSETTKEEVMSSFSSVTTKQSSSRHSSKKQSYVHSEKELVSPKIVQQVPRPQTEELEPFPFRPDPVRPSAKRSCPPPPSPSKFIKGDFKENEYGTDHELQMQQMWRGEDKSYKPVRPVLTPSGYHSTGGGRTPTPPTEFDVPPRVDGPPRPKFEPIAPAPTSRPNVKLDEIIKSVESSQTLVRPKPLTPKQYKEKDTFNLKPGSPPEIAFSPGYPNAVETSNVMSFQESTETSRRVVNLQQTTRMISFGNKDVKQQVKIEPFPYKPETDKPKPKKAQAPTKFNESDYESDLYFHHKRITTTPQVTRSTSVPVGHESETKRIQRVEELKKRFSDKSFVLPDIELKPGEPPEYGFIQAPVHAAQTYASKHMQDMTNTFKSKAQQFVNDVMTDVKKPEKPILKSTSGKTNGVSDEPQAYREESRLSEYGTKHIDPDTGLIYFKYDFGYEFGVILPGEGGGSVSGGNKTTNKKPKLQSTGKSESIDFPIIHETTKQNNRPKKYCHYKSVKWDGMSESDMSELDDSQKRRSLPNTSQPLIYIPGVRWENTPSPISLSPSIPSLSPKYPGQQNIAHVSASPASSLWLSPNKMKTNQQSPGSQQKNVVCSNYDPPKTPSFITPMKDIAVVSGLSARFECIVQAEPTPNVIWSKDGRILENGQYYQIQYKNGVCRLTIPKAYPEDSGTYTCTATNMVGTAGTTATLQVPGEKMGKRNHY